MIGKQTWKSLLILFAILLIKPAFVGLAQSPVRSYGDAWGKRFRPAGGRSQSVNTPPLGENARARLFYWNRIAIDASGLDHIPVAPGEPRVFGEQLGPGRAARAMAIVHIAIFDAMNSVGGSYQSYTGLPFTRADASMDAAIAQSAADSLGAMFPSQRSAFQQLLADDMAQIPAGPRRDNGIEAGRRAAAAIVAMRANDGSRHPEPIMNVDYHANTRMGFWHQDPISLIPVVLGAHWGAVRPFSLASTSQFRVPPPPAMDSPEYAAAYNEVKRLGGDGVATPTERTLEQTQIGIYWAYDGTPSLCAPTRLYNQLLVQFADQMQSNAIESGRLLALANLAMADAGIASWESKFYYSVWRPISGIREAETGLGSHGFGDGNPETTGDPNFIPLGAPASNLMGPNFTPPFPSYPSGHAVFGGAVFQTLRNFYHTDNIPFTFVSDEFNGITVDNNGNPRPLLPRSFANLSQAEEENGQSRIYLGIHWSYDKTEGIAQGRKIGDWVYTHAFGRLRR